jgi:hypothetical protein
MDTNLRDGEIVDGAVPVDPKNVCIISDERLAEISAPAYIARVAQRLSELLPLGANRANHIAGTFRANGMVTNLGVEGMNRVIGTEFGLHYVEVDRIADKVAAQYADLIGYPAFTPPDSK